jgi:hypothetical protein
LFNDSMADQGDEEQRQEAQIKYKYAMIERVLPRAPHDIEST